MGPTASNLRLQGTDANLASTASTRQALQPVTSGKAATAVSAQTAPASESVEALQQAVKEANQALQRVSPGLEFSLEQGSDRVIVRVVDSETDEILLQIPSEQMLAISRALDDLRGLLFEQEA